MKDIFSLDGGVMGFLSRISDLFILNLIFILTCIPLVTIGPALTALYSVTLKMAKDEESYVFKSYISAFRKNFKISFLSWLIILLASALLFLDYRILSQFSGPMRTLFSVLLLNVCFLLLLVALFLFPYIARFQTTLKQSFKNSILIAIVSLPYTFLILLITVGFVLLVIFIPIKYAVLLCLLFTFSVLAYIQSFMFRKIFAKYESKTECDEPSL